MTRGTVASGVHCGQVLGNVRLDRLLGEGAVGVVYQGRHLTLGIDVAVKLLQPGDDERTDALYHERFRREARIAARLNHPGIVRVLDFGDKDGTPYMVMELVEGMTLEQHLQRRPGPLAEATVLRVLLAVASALAVAHGEGIVHRDLKPANLLINRKGVLKVADLGLARELGGAQLTRERVSVGTPLYMSPESLTPGTPVDHRSDLYALGVIGYQLAFGRVPYSGTIAQVVHGQLGGRASFALPTACGRPIIAIIERLMSRDPAQRHPDAQALADEVRALISGERRKARPRERSGASSSGGGDPASLARFLEGTFGETSSEVSGRRITHTTARERYLVWLLLAGLVVAALAGFALSGP